MSSLTPFLKRSALAFTVLIAASAWSQCNNPSSPGVVICTPTNGSTVIYGNEISIRSTPASGATITGFSIYTNGSLFYKSSPNQSGIDLYDGALYVGHYDMVVKASDTDGNQYQATSNFTVIGPGAGFAPCTIPTSPGINFCIPPADAISAPQILVGAAALGESPIKRLNLYLNGKYLSGVSNNASVITYVTVAEQGVPNTVTFQATDSEGHQYTASRKLEADYTYSQYSCFYSCTPGVNPVSPIAEAYVGSSFDLDMEIEDNPNPITSMAAYIDNTLIASSDNATLQKQITNAPNGTHILTVKGLDSEGLKYFYQENININVNE
jgi:hypothetical protein